MNYKGYDAVVEYDEEAHLFHGEVLHLRDVITFQGDSVTELEQAFHDSVEDYIDFCASRGEKPEKPYSGKMILRIKPELHKEITYQARAQGVSVNTMISEALKEYTSKRK
jgi:predicted HicB family RNase H-like nuclease